MIVKKRIKPLKLFKFEALFRRLDLDHPKRQIASETYAKSLAGYRGERSLDFPLSFLPEQKYHVLHDLRLYDGSHYFQIDCLLLSSNLIIIIEVKNITGTLIFDSTFNQLIRINDNKDERAFSSPIIQVNRHVEQLQKWLKLQKFPAMPIEPLVIIGNDKSVIKSTEKGKSQTLSQFVLPYYVLPDKIKELEVRHTTYLLTKESQHTLSKQLQIQHHPLKFNILQHFQISESDLIKGIQCTNCKFYSMHRTFGTWACDRCMTTSKKAHMQALRDYYLLIGTTINNRQMNDFLQICSPHITKHLLNSLCSITIGTNKGRKYVLSFAFE
ncbi:NERD domain-containing protein [Fictibacillus nanhaiensis]|uniref:NERD domain-containing protein n=1 Tax=Fictibacillus nanhaiensis TaxID=742169 RepID=A0ABS2ZSW6_9BACL|nr:NERD domain-containing protein [Fictibacillus nanhaiensis]